LQFILYQREKHLSLHDIIKAYLLVCPIEITQYHVKF